MPYLVILPSNLPPPPSPPVNITLPTLSGTVQDGQTLVASNGTWSGTPTSFAYAYYFDGTQDLSQTTGTVNLTGKTGKFLYVIVTAHNAGGDTTAQSITYGPIQAAPSFSFTPVTGATTSTVYTSNMVTMPYNGSISVTGGTYSKNGGSYTSVSGTANLGDTITLRGTSAPTSTTAINVIFTINTFNAQFSITTAAGSGFTTIPVTLGDTYNFATKSNGNLTLTADPSYTWYNQAAARSTYKLSPMTYFEVTVNQLPCYIGIGAFTCNLQDYPGNANDSIGINCTGSGDAANGIVFQNGGFAMQFQTSHPPGVGTVIGIAFDDSNRAYFSVNGNWTGDFGYVFNPTAKTGGLQITTTTPANCEIGVYVAVNGLNPSGHVISGQLTCNFGATAFVTSAPISYQSLNDSQSGNPPNPAARVPVAPTKPTNYPSNFWSAYAPSTYPGVPATVDYYIDKDHAGASDNNDGRSPSTPWKTLASVAGRSFLPGTVIAFNRGTGPYQGDSGNPNTTRMQLVCNGSAAYPIIFTAYGTGAQPIIKAINADYESSIAVGIYSGANFGLTIGPRTCSHLVIDGLALTGGRVGSGSTIGNQACITFNAGSNNIEVYNCEMYNNGGGPYNSGGGYNLTCNFNYVHDLTEVVDDGTGGSFGSEGITIGGTVDSPCHDCTFKWNSFKNCLSNSVAFAYDGGIMELFGYVSNITLKYNFCENSQGSVEGGGFPGYATNFDISYNIFKDCATMTVFHNAGGAFGGVFQNISMNYNTFYQTTTNPPDTHLGVFYTDGPLDATQVTAQYNIFLMAQPSFGFWANGSAAQTPTELHSFNDYCRGGVSAGSLPIMFGSAGAPNTGLGVSENIIGSSPFTDPSTNDFSLSGSTGSGRGALPGAGAGGGTGGGGGGGANLSPPFTSSLPAAFVSVMPTLATPPTPDIYYDPQGGSDSNNGLSAGAPVATMAYAVTLAQAMGPGHCIGVKRGSVTNLTAGVFIDNWIGTEAQPNWITQYGAGTSQAVFRTIQGGTGGDGSTLYSALTVRLSTCWLNIDGGPTMGMLFTEARDGGIWVEGQNGEHYWSAGDGIRIYRCEFSRCGIGIELDGSGDGDRAEQNYIHDGVMVWNNNGSADYGANGVRVANGSNKKVRFNRMDTLWALDPFYGSDGGAVEFYSGSVTGCEVSYNFATFCNGFTEGGGPGSVHTDISIHNNLIVNCRTFATFHTGGAFGCTWINGLYYNNTFVQYAPAFPTSGYFPYVYGVASSMESHSPFTFYNNVFYVDEMQGNGIPTMLSLYSEDMDPNDMSWAHDNYYYVPAARSYFIPNTTPLGEGGLDLAGFHMFNTYKQNVGAGDVRLLPTTALFVDLAGGDYRIAPSAAAYGKGAL